MKAEITVRDMELIRAYKKSPYSVRQAIELLLSDYGFSDRSDRSDDSSDGKIIPLMKEDERL